LKSQHGITEQDFSKISIGVAFYGRGQANVTHATPENLPGSPASGGTEGGTVEPAVFSYFDLRDNFIGPDGRGINGWKVYNYPEYAASLLYNQDTGEAISFTVPEDMQAIANYVKENGFKGMFSWQIDDDNGELLETIHQTLGHPQATPRVADRPYIYAPDCVTMAPTHIAPGLVFSDAGNVYVGSGWPAACPNQGASWEQNSWTLIGSTDEFTVLGAWETNDDGGTGDGGAGDGGTGDSNAWVPGQVYATAGAEVSHNGRTWTNSWWTNGEPGIDPAWTITSAINNGDAWIPGHAYETAGAEVSHNGKLYRNQWWTNGEPGIDAAWVEISGTSDAPETPVDTPDEGDESPELPSDGDLWRSDYTYATAGKIVVHPSGGPSWFNTGYTLGDTPGSSVEWQPQTITDGDPWNSLVLYDAATRNEGSRQYVVAHNGELWVNQYYTLGDVPGSSPAWARQDTPANGDLWRADYVYATAGKIVVYPSGGSSWYNSGYSLGDQPDQTVVWQPVTITDGDPWDPLVIYDASTRNEGNRQYVVTHSGERWVNQYYSLGDQPGTSTAWARDYTFTAGDAWRSDYVYSQPNMVVAYPNAGGKLWFNTAYSLGDTPTVSTVWQPVTLTDGDPWDPLVIYSASARSETRSYYEVLHNGKLWRNSTYSLNEEPGKSAAWQPSTLVDNDPWDANIIYDGPTRGEGNRTYIVTHAGQIWSNAYYSLGDEPGSSSAWVPVVTHSDGDIWSATYIYATAGAIVRYPANGALWYNLYYSANEQPGTTQTWQPVSIVDEDPWQANVIYDATTRGEGSRFYIVSHNGSLWQNTTYSVGETPSATAVTWAPVAPAGDGIPLWNSATVYSVAGTIVKDANGRKWYNEYWTQNDVPGASNVWQPVSGLGPRPLRLRI
jgi:hypothetical protein